MLHNCTHGLQQNFIACKPRSTLKQNNRKLKWDPWFGRVLVAKRIGNWAQGARLPSRTPMFDLKLVYLSGKWWFATISQCFFCGFKTGIKLMSDIVWCLREREPITYSYSQKCSCAKLASAFRSLLEGGLPGWKPFWVYIYPLKGSKSWAETLFSQLCSVNSCGHLFHISEVINRFFPK